MSEARFGSVLQGIRDLLAQSTHDEERYTPRPCLTEQQIEAWEDLHAVTLPEQYRVFLQEVGNGGRMPGSYCDFVIESLAKVRGGWTASAPFPVTAERLRERLRQLDADGRPADGVLFPELEPYWEEAGRPPGCLVFGQYPCADGLFLVTTGDLRGSVWCSVCAGIPETDESGEPTKFLGWFANTLAELLDDQ
jgi:hypothetical protein